ncbi:predicted GPI-anchored protein 58 [Corvus cornix cornix]|uniref:predicted GPI-anchored protein 58 n=1 Tax=Corvus cornix cornix TaxID=932674 RepID=UPI001950F422|nr:predicted GPI-anchored protein 58 [Corvus cornix cornix]
MSDGGMSKGASDGESKKTPSAPQTEPALPCPAQSQDSAAPRDPALAEAGMSGQREGAQYTLLLSSAAATAYPGPQISGLANWTPVAAPSPFAYAPTEPKSPGSNFLAGVAPGVTAPRLPGCGPLPSLALGCCAPLQNRAIDLLIQHLPLLTELTNISRKLEDLHSLQKQLPRTPEAPRRAGSTGPTLPAPPAGAAAPKPRSCVAGSEPRSSAATGKPGSGRGCRAVAGGSGAERSQGARNSSGLGSGTERGCGARASGGARAQLQHMGHRWRPERCHRARDEHSAGRGCCPRVGCSSSSTSSVGTG